MDVADGRGRDARRGARWAAAALIRRFDFELQPGYRLRTRQAPTIGPRDGMPLTVRRRGRAAAPSPQPAAV